MRIRRGHNAGDAALAIVAENHLAVVGLEVQQPRPRAEGDAVRPVIERIGEPRLAATVAGPPAHGDAPERGVDRIGIPQRVQVHRDHFDTSASQRGQVTRGQGAVHIVDRIGDQQDPQAWLRAFARQQGVAQFHRQLPMRLFLECTATLVIEQEEIQHQVFARFADQADHRVEDLLANHGFAVDVDAGDVAEELQVAERCADHFTADAHALGQGFEEIPERDQDPEGEKSIGEQSPPAALAGRSLRGRRRIRDPLYGCRIRLFSHSAILAAPTVPASVSPIARSRS